MQEYGNRSEEEQDFYSIEAGKPEDAVAAYLHAIDNPGTVIGLNYDTSFIQRGITEELHDEELPAHTRVPGGATTYPDENYRELIVSGGSFQDYRQRMFEEVEKVEPRAAVTEKDIFLDNGEDIEDWPKIVGMAAHVNPNLFGAGWREKPPTRQTLENIEEDVTEATPEQYRKLSYSFEKNSGKSFWKHLTEDATQLTAEELLEQTDSSFEELEKDRVHEPKSCRVHYRPTGGAKGSKTVPNHLPANQ